VSEIECGRDGDHPEAAELENVRHPPRGVGHGEIKQPILGTNQPHRPAAATIWSPSRLARSTARNGKATEEAIVYDPEPRELEEIVRDEQEARLRLDEARDKARRNEGETPTEDHELIQRLEADWKHALERLHRIRGHSDG
jgi:hypothetical protein